jgi:hypothetical protein
MGSGYSYFNKQEVYGNNAQLLESINEVGVLANMLFNTQLSDSDKKGLSPMLGFNYTTPTATAGHPIFSDTSVNNLTFDYAIPLIGILGSGTSKLIPVGKLLSLRLELTVDAFANFTKNTTPGTGDISSCTISNVEFVANYIRLSPEAEAIINQQNPEKIHIRTQTWRQTSGQIGSASGAGTYDILCSIRVNSLKSIYALIYPTTASEGKYAGVNPGLTQGTCFLIAGASYPQRTLDPSGKPADTFAELQKSFGALSYNAYNSCITKAGYYVSSSCSDASGTASQFTGSLTQAFNATAANVAASPNQFYLGIDTEVLARKDSLLSGLNTTSAPMQFRAQIGGYYITNAVHNINFFGFYDVILEIDTQSRNVVALV